MRQRTMIIFEKTFVRRVRQLLKSDSPKPMPIPSSAGATSPQQWCGVWHHLPRSAQRIATPSDNRLCNDDDDDDDDGDDEEDEDDDGDDIDDDDDDETNGNDDG